MGWQTFLQQTVMAGVTAASGAAAGAVTVNPLVGAAASEAARKAAQQVLDEFLPAQKDAVAQLVERTRSMEVLLGAVRTDIQSVVDGYWRAALLHVADGARHPERAQTELLAARDSLFQAYGAAAGGSKRALVGQQLAVVYGLLGESEDRRMWLRDSYADACVGLGEEVDRLVVSVESMPRVKSRVDAVDLHAARVRAGVLAVYRTARVGPVCFVAPEPLTAALAGLAQTRRDLAALRFCCALAGMTAPWSDPAPWNVTGGLYEGRQVVVMQKPPQVMAGALVPSRDHCAVVGSPDDSPRRPAVLLNGLNYWRFRVADGPPPPAQMFVVGSSPELGEWDLRRGVPLIYSNLSWGVQLGGILDADNREATAFTGQSDLMSYRYFCIEQPGAAPVYGGQGARQLPPLSDMRFGGPQCRITPEESWVAQ